MKIKNTKRALLMSGLSLMLCMSMLIGSTFAWFTDSVTSAGNRIQSGNLEIQLLAADQRTSLEGKMINWSAKDGRAQDEILWEPGCTYNTEEFYIKNAGNLKLKFKFDVTGITGDAELLEAIDFKCTQNGADFEFNTDAEYVLEPGEKMGPFVLSGHMDEEAGNKYQNLTIENIAISLLATQATGEEDSFDGTYDEKSKFELPENNKPENLPIATVVRVEEYENKALDWENVGGFYPTAGLDSQLEAAYTFTCKESVSEAEKNPYANWYCDFYVKLDKDLAENQIFLGGNYGSFGWVGFHNGTVTLDANEEIPLLGSVTKNPWTYAQVASFVGEFTCGVGDVDDALKGATFTVMLRLTNPDDLSEFYDVETINYTFK